MKGPFAGGWDLTDSALPFAPHMLFFFPFHLPSSPFLPHCLLLLCSTRYCCCCCCCCSLLLHPFQHTPVDAAAPCCTRSNILHCCHCCFNHHFGFQLRYRHGTHGILPPSPSLARLCVPFLSFSTLSQIGLSQSSSFF